MMCVTPVAARSLGLRIRIRLGAWAFLLFSCSYVFQAEISATGRSLVQWSATECVCVCVTSNKTITMYTLSDQVLGANMSH